MKSFLRLFMLMLFSAVSICVGVSDSHAATTAKETIVQCDNCFTLDAEYISITTSPLVSHGLLCSTPNLGALESGILEDKVNSCQKDFDPPNRRWARAANTKILHKVYAGNVAKRAPIRKLRC